MELFILSYAPSIQCPKGQKAQQWCKHLLRAPLHRRVYVFACFARTNYRAGALSKEDAKTKMYSSLSLGHYVHSISNKIQ